MYMSLMGKPNDQELEKYPHVLLISPHGWDPSVLDCAHPNMCVYPSWAPDPSVRYQHDARIDECGNFRGRVVQTLSILSEEPIASVKACSETYHR